MEDCEIQQRGFDDGFWRVNDRQFRAHLSPVDKAMYDSAFVYGRQHRDYQEEKAKGKTLAGQLSLSAQRCDKYAFLLAAEKHLRIHGYLPAYARRCRKACDP